MVLPILGAYSGIPQRFLWAQTMGRLCLTAHLEGTSDWGGQRLTAGHQLDRQLDLAVSVLVALTGPSWEWPFQPLLSNSLALCFHGGRLWL